MSNRLPHCSSASPVPMRQGLEIRSKQTSNRFSYKTHFEVSYLACATLVCTMICMIAESEARELIGEGLAAWNSHDLDPIISHYDANVVLISPVAAKILDHPSGTVAGRAALRDYFSA